MKTSKLTKAITAIALISSTAAYADNSSSQKEVLKETRKLGTFVTSAAVGAAAGGPIGLFIGGITGAVLGEHFNNHDTQTAALEKSQMNLSLMDEELKTQDLEMAKLEKLIQEKMQFQLYFNTGEDQLSEADQDNLNALADFLTEVDYMHVSIDGHADPRGTDEYNQILSEHRAYSVAEALTKNGVDAARISTRGYGADFSAGLQAEPSNYAMERKVKVEVFPSKESAGLATLK